MPSLRDLALIHIDPERGTLQRNIIFIFVSRRLAVCRGKGAL